jgi:hypothetical protein
MGYQNNPGSFDDISETFEKCSILFKVNEGENSNHRNTLKYFEDYNLSLTPRLGKRGRFSRVSLFLGVGVLECWSTGVFGTVLSIFS